MKDMILRIFENGLTASNILLLIEMLIATFIAIAIYKYVTKLVAYWQFKKNPYVAKGVKVTTSFDGISFITGTIKRVTPNRVEILDENRRAIVILLKEFMRRTWRFEDES